MQYADKHLVCRDCAAGFIFTANEQEFFRQKGLINEPRRCEACRVVMRAARQGKQVELTAVDCEQCGAQTKVTFKPTGRKPVLCLQCFHAARSAAPVAVPV